jgi:hypothetical protein
MAPRGPFKLVTVNTAPERAKILIGRVVEALKDDYTIEYVANCASKQTTMRCGQRKTSTDSRRQGPDCKPCTGTPTRHPSE